MISIISPADNRVVAERELLNETRLQRLVTRAQAVQPLWQQTALTERATLCRKAIELMLADKQRLAREITLQMGRPLRYTGAEIDGLAERARYMIEIAPECLQTTSLPPRNGTERFIQQVPLGLVLVIAPWNYPYLTAVNSVVPALMAGNCVLLKHSAQTLLCAEAFQRAFELAGLPAGVLQYCHLDHDTTGWLTRHPAIALIVFTGSVPGGKAIEQACSGLFKTVALELGGKDPAYVRADADIAFTAAQLADGAFFNSGQSCCAVERIYVHKRIFSQFVDSFCDRVSDYRLGDPTDPATTLGPVVNTRAADRVRRQLTQATTQGATALIDSTRFAADQGDDQYLAPQVLVDVDHDMDVMREETFGPLVGLMPVDTDKQAVTLMNDSQYGLTASVWTADKQAAITLGRQLHTGTVYMNRCDYLDPALAWTGVRNSGRGVTLSRLGYTQLTRPHSFYLQEH